MSNKQSPVPTWALAGVVLLVLGLGATTLLYVAQRPGADAGAPPAGAAPPGRYPGLPRESVRAQDLSTIDCKNPVIVKALPRMMQTWSRPEKLVVIAKLKEAATPEAVDTLEAVATAVPDPEKPNEDARAHAVGALVGIGSKASWASVSRLATSSDKDVRRMAASSLGYSDATEARRLLGDLSRDKDADVAKAGSEALHLCEKRGR